MKKTVESDNIYKIAFLVAISCVLQISESLIPHPIPGLRLGLANVITLIALVTIGIRYTLEVTILRTILSSFIMGTFMSPAFILSFSGGIASTLIMGLFYWLTRIRKRYYFSIIGISIIGALIHNTTQIFMAYFILIKHPGIFVMFPWLSIGAVFMGWVTGFAAGGVCKRLKGMKAMETMDISSNTDYSKLLQRDYAPGNSFIHRMPAEIKIILIFIISIIMFVFSNLWLYIALSILLISTAIISRTSIILLLSKLKRYVSLILISFLFPVFLNHGNNILLKVSFLKITSEGLEMGALFSMRLIFLILLSSLLVRTTAPMELTQGLSRILLPFRALGISGERIASIFSLSWMAIPIFWEMAGNIIRGINARKVRKIRYLIPLLSDFIATLYLETEQITAYWEKSNMLLGHPKSSDSLIGSN